MAKRLAAIWLVASTVRNLGTRSAIQYVVNKIDKYIYHLLGAFNGLAVIKTSNDARSIGNSAFEQNRSAAVENV